MPYIDRTVFTSNDQSSGEVADPNLLESNDKHVADVVDANYTELMGFVNGENISQMGIVNVKDYEAVGDGVTDDTTAIKDALTYVNTNGGVLYFPAGVYAYSGLLGTITKPIAVVGQGSRLTKLKNISDTYSGYAIEIDDTWYDSGSNYIYDENPSDENSGVILEGFSIEGNRAYNQKGINFKNRNDNFLLNNLQFNFLNGLALNLGDENSTYGLVREGVLLNVHFRDCGNSSEPSMFLGNSDTVGDSSNNIDIFGLKIIHPRGVGLRVKSSNTNNALRRVNFYGFMLHGTPSQDLIGDLLEIYGRCEQIDIFGLRSNHSSVGYYCISVKSDGTYEPKYITIQGNINNADSGINVDAGQQIELWFRYIYSAATDIKVGQNVTQEINIINALPGWTIDIHASVKKYVSTRISRREDIPFRSLRYYFGNEADSPSLSSGIGSPEGAIVSEPGSFYFDKTATGIKNGRNIWVKTVGSSNTGWMPIQPLTAQSTANRPTSNISTGQMYFDTSLGQPIWYNGTDWVDATGTIV